MDTPVGDRGGHRGRVKPLSPLGTRHVGGQHGGLTLVPLTDDLEEEVRALLAKGTIPPLVTDQEVRCGVMLELFQPRVVGLRRNEMVAHVQGRGTEPREVGMAGRRGEACRQEGCARPGMANEHASTVGGDAVEVAERQNTGVLLLSGLMMGEVQRVNRPVFCARRLPPAEGDRGVPAVLQCDVREEIAGRDHIQGVLHGVLQGGGELLEHACAAEGGALVCAPLGGGHARVLVRTKASYAARAGASSRIWWRCACWQPHGGMLPLGGHLLGQHIFASGRQRPEGESPVAWRRVALGRQRRP